MKEASRKTVLGLFIFRFLRLLISVATLSASAHFFGVGFERESWILSMNFVVIVQLALWGPLNETFRAKFIFLKAGEGETTALRRTASLLWFSLVAMAIVVIVMETFSVPLARFIAPAFTAAQAVKLAILLRYLLWSAVLVQATQLLSSILNTYNSFYIPEISGFVAGILNLALIVLLSRTIGIYSLLIATYVSTVLLLAGLIFQVKKMRIPLFSIKASFSWNQIKPFILYALPFLFPYLLGQCNSFLEKFIANLLQHNSVAILDYARKIADIVQTVLTSVLATIMVPVLSTKFSAQQDEALAEESQKHMRLILLILTFVVPMMVLCSDAVTDILYDKGSIAPDHLSTISILIKAYGISLLPVFAYIVFGFILLSVNKGKQYAFYGMIAQIIMMTINILLYRYWGIFTFVVSLSVSHLISAIFLFHQLPYSKSQHLQDILKYGLIILLVILAGILVNTLIYMPEGSYLQIAYNGLLSGILILSLAHLLRLPEMPVLKTFLSKFKS